MPSSGFCDWVLIMVFLVVCVGVFLLGVRVVSRVWHTESPMRKEVRSMRFCRQCGWMYTREEVQDMLSAMGFGPGGDPVDEDYLVVIDGLCPDCWPELA